MRHSALIIVWLIGLGYATIPLFWLMVHPFAGRWAVRKGRVFPILGFFWLIIIVVFARLTWRWHLDVLYQTRWSWLVGGLLACFDIFLLRKVGTYFGRDRLIGKMEIHPEQHEQKLITTGMHGRMRHPIYLAHLIMLLALTLGSGLLVLFVLLAFAVVTGAFMIRAEDAELEKRFGEEYREYKQRVPAISIF